MPALVINEADADDEAEEQDDSGAPEYLWQFQELLRCTMGINSVMDLLLKYNCSECQT